MLETVRSPLRRWLLSWLALVSGVAAVGSPYLSEFSADNSAGLADEDGAFSDWIEIHNPDAAPVFLGGYHLTDDPARPARWTFPPVTLDPGAYLVVFASGKDRTDPAGRLHANFQLAAEGGYVALVAPDAVTVLSAFAPGYPSLSENESFGIAGNGASPVWALFSQPTPGSANQGGTRAGPVIVAAEANPAPPVSGPMVVAARVWLANDPVSTVSLVYRRMYGAETAVPMADDGTGADVVAGDGLWTASIPESAFGPSEMTRWRFTARDTRGTESREPAFRAPLDSPQYFGTVAPDATLRSLLPVVHWFTTNSARADTVTGSRGSVYYGGEFYDNVVFSLHGQSSSGFPKKSYNIDFNRRPRFRWSPDAPRVADIDLLSNWADKSKVRHVLGYEVMREAGVATHFAFTVRVQQNGRFFSTADFVEDADEIYLERAGLNPDGALYKVYANLLNKDAGNTGTSGVEKKTRRTENNADLQALINGLDLTGTALARYLYDNIDIPRCVNMLAANSVIRNIDMHSKNWYAYRDTGRSGEWAILPWDLDLSHGRVWNTQNTYFDNALYTDGFVVTGNSIRLVDHLFSNPATRAMILRRIRTLTDRFLQPPPVAGTPESSLYYERRLNEQSALLDPPAIAPSDARLDFEKWGSWLQGGSTVRYTNANVAVETMAEALQRWRTEYLPGRRAYIYNTQIVGRGGEIPLPQTGGGATTNFLPLVVRGAAVRAFVPADGRLGLSWTGDPASEPFATTGWTAGTTGVGYERATGYESLIGLDVGTRMQNNNSVYLRIEFDVDDPAAFDRLELRMKYDDGFAAFLNGTPIAAANAPATLQWNSAATVSREANPAAFTVFDVTDRMGSLRAGRNVLAIQGLNDAVTSSDLIFVPELHGARIVVEPSRQPKLRFGVLDVNPVSGNQDEEFVQLVNPTGIAVDVSDWRLAGAVDHVFAPGTVIPAGGALYVCPDVAVFRARTVSPKGGEALFVQGGYRGHLSNLGETLTLLDDVGATNAVTTYEAQPSPAQRQLVISELMYHPAGDGLAEFVELLNVGTNAPLDLRGVRFTRGIEFDFTGGQVTQLAPGARVLVVRDRAAFTAAYGTNHPVAGVFANGTALGNGGDRIKLEDPANGTVADFAYDDAVPWPSGADAGYSLVLVSPETRPDPALPSSWRASRRPGGSPGGPETDGFPANPAADANGNGEPDLIDYVLGNDLGLPAIPPGVIAVTSPSGGVAELRFAYPLSSAATNAAVVVSYSHDLVTWQAAAALLEPVSREALGDGRDLVTWRLGAAWREAPRVFLRLEAVAR